jgi:hypothetical protein
VNAVAALVMFCAFVFAATGVLLAFLVVDSVTLAVIGLWCLFASCALVVIGAGSWLDDETERFEDEEAA